MIVASPCLRRDNGPMWVRNKATGLVWEVHGELADRLSQSMDYEVIEEPKRKSGEGDKQTRKRKKDN